MPTETVTPGVTTIVLHYHLSRIGWLFVESYNGSSWNATGISRTYPGDVKIETADLRDVGNMFIGKVNEGDIINLKWHAEQIARFVVRGNRLELLMQRTGQHFDEHILFELVQEDMDTLFN